MSLMAKSGISRIDFNEKTGAFDEVMINVDDTSSYMDYSQLSGPIGDTKTERIKNNYKKLVFFQTANFIK